MGWELSQLRGSTKGVISERRTLTLVWLHPVFCSRTDDSYPKSRLFTKHKVTSLC